jgi:hypothetical protein
MTPQALFCNIVFERLIKSRFQNRLFVHFPTRPQVQKHAQPVLMLHLRGGEVVGSPAVFQLIDNGKMNRVLINRHMLMLTRGRYDAASRNVLAMLLVSLEINATLHA